MRGIWSGIDERIRADQARNEADWLDAMEWPGGDVRRLKADRHDQEADRLDDDW